MLLLLAVLAADLALAKAESSIESNLVELRSALASLQMEADQTDQQRDGMVISGMSSMASAAVTSEKGCCCEPEFTWDSEKKKCVIQGEAGEKLEDSNVAGFGDCWDHNAVDCDMESGEVKYSALERGMLMSGLKSLATGKTGCCCKPNTAPKESDKKQCQHECEKLKEQYNIDILVDWHDANEAGDEVKNRWDNELKCNDVLGKPSPDVEPQKLVFIEGSNKMGFGVCKKVWATECMMDGTRPKA